MSDSKVIWKYPVVHDSPIFVPANHLLLDVQYQGALLCAWFLVDPEVKDLKRVVFYIFATGEEFGSGLSKICRHAKTVQQGSLVWHVFQRVGL